MKRWLGLALAAVLLAVTAHAWYVRAHRPVEPYGPEIAWLARELALSPDQITRIHAVHVAHCPQLDVLHCELVNERTAGGDIERCETIQNQCASSTEMLIREVSLLLTPAQRPRYLELVAPCLRSGPPVAP